MEEKKKNSDTVKNIVIIILSVCVVVLGGILLYSKVFKKDTPSNIISNKELVNENFTIGETVGEIVTKAGNFLVNLKDFQVLTTDNKVLGYCMDADDYSLVGKPNNVKDYDWNSMLQASSEGIYVNSEKDASGTIYKYDASGKELGKFDVTYKSADNKVSITIVDNNTFFAKGFGVFDHKISSLVKDGAFTFIDFDTASCGEYGPEISIKNNVIVAAPNYNAFNIDNSGSLIVYYPSPAGDFILAENYDCGDYGTDDRGMGGILVTKSGKTIGRYSYGADAYTINGELIGPYYSVDKTGIYIMDATATDEILCRHDVTGKRIECK